FMHGAVAQPVGDDLLPGGEVVGVLDDVAKGIDVADQATGVVIFVAHGTDPTRILDLKQAMAEVIEELGGIPYWIGMAREVAVGIISVPDDIPLGIRDLGNAPLSIAQEGNALPRRVENTIRTEGQTVAVGFTNALYSAILIDNENATIHTG